MANSQPPRSSTVDVNPRTREVRSDLFEQSLKALEGVIKMIYGEDFPVVLTTDDEEFRTLYAVDGKIPSAFCKYSLQTGSLNNDSYNRTVSTKDGINIKPVSDGQTMYKLHFKPVRAMFNIEFKSNSFKKALKFFDNWMMYHKKWSYSLDTHGVSLFDIQVAPSEELQFGADPLEDEGGKWHSVSGTIDMATYVARITAVPTVGSIVVSGYAVSQTDRETIEAQGNAAILAASHAFDITVTPRETGVPLP